MDGRDHREGFQGSNSASPDSPAGSNAGSDDLPAHDAYGTSPATSGTNQSTRSNFFLKSSLFSPAQRNLGSETSSDRGGGSYLVASCPRSTSADNVPRSCQEDGPAELCALFNSIYLTPRPDISAWLKKLPPHPKMKPEISKSPDVKPEQSKDSIDVQDPEKQNSAEVPAEEILQNQPQDDTGGDSRPPQDESEDDTDASVESQLS